MFFRYTHVEHLPCGTTICANLHWPSDKGPWPMQRGAFPPEHPSKRFATELAAFRARGYYVGSFTEGDGFTLDLLRNQAAEQVIQDIRECFPGWVRVRRELETV
jgi:hypothetical protein